MVRHCPKNVCSTVHLIFVILYEIGTICIPFTDKKKNIEKRLLTVTAHWLTAKLHVYYKWGIDKLSLMIYFLQVAGAPKLVPSGHEQLPPFILQSCTNITIFHLDHDVNGNKRNKTKTRMHYFKTQLKFHLFHSILGPSQPEVIFSLTCIPIAINT